MEPSRLTFGSSKSTAMPACLHAAQHAQHINSGTVETHTMCSDQSVVTLNLRESHEIFARISDKWQVTNGVVSARLALIHADIAQLMLGQPGNNNAHTPRSCQKLERKAWST